MLPIYLYDNFNFFKNDIVNGINELLNDKEYNDIQKKNKKLKYVYI